MTYLRRKIDAFLEQWKSDSGKKPLIVKAQGRLGKPNQFVDSALRTTIP